MTVSMQITKRIYAGNGVTRLWDVDFPLSASEDLCLYVTSPAGAEEKVTEFFELNSEATQLTYPTLQSGLAPLAEGWSLTLVRQTPLTQETDLIRQGELDAEVLERGYDKLTLMVQELDEKVSRSIKYPVSSQVDDLETDNFLKNILTAKQETLDASAQAVSSADVARQSAQDAQRLAGEAVESISSAGASAQNALTALGDAQAGRLQSFVELARTEADTARYYAERSIGKTVGEVYWSQSADFADNPGALPLFTGETIATANTLYPDFWAWVLSHPELGGTPEEYASALSAYGECPYYAADEETGALRLPLLKHYVKCANPADGIAQEKAGLPNIVGTFTGLQDNESYVTGSCVMEGSSVYSTAGQGNYNRKVHFDASRSSSVYGNSDTVTPAHTTLYPWVCAYNAAVAASTAQAAAFQEALSGKVDLPAGTAQAAVDFVAEHYADEDGNWCRTYKNGWLEMGGAVTADSNGTGEISFLKAFLDTNYVVKLNIKQNPSNGIFGGVATVSSNISSTGFSYKAYGVNSNNGTLVSSLANSAVVYWEAKGQGAENV